MDTITILASIISSLGITTTGAWWLGKKLITHQFNKDLAAHKIAWQKDLEQQKAILSGEIRRDVENDLANKAADRQYELEARKRLYQEIGPLRFQLLTACRDAAHHIKSHSVKYDFIIDMDNHYGRDMTFKLLRPISISELIEQKIHYADFSVDPTAILLLRFKKSAYQAFTSHDIIYNNPNAKYDREVDHVFDFSLNKVTNLLIKNDENNSNRVMHYHEFETFIEDEENISKLTSFTRILNNFTINDKPIFWLRLVFFGLACSQIVNLIGKSTGFEEIMYNTSELLKLPNDRYINHHIDNYVAIFKKTLDEGL